MYHITNVKVLVIGVISNEPASEGVFNIFLSLIFLFWTIICMSIFIAFNSNAKLRKIEVNKALDFALRTQLFIG